MAEICPTAMLFLRCRGGISHHPDEFVSEADIEMGLEVLTDAVRTWPPNFSEPSA
jgi:allantoate deiminase